MLNFIMHKYVRSVGKTMHSKLMESPLVDPGTHV